MTLQKSSKLNPVEGEHTGSIGVTAQKSCNWGKRNRMKMGWDGAQVVAWGTSSKSCSHCEKFSFSLYKMVSYCKTLSRRVTELHLNFRRTAPAAVLERTVKAASVETRRPIRKITQERDDKKKRSDFGSNLKKYSTSFAERLEIDCERKGGVKHESKMFCSTITRM